ncbi:MAG: hydroxyacid dehydrogenase [Candidatus Bathyarchaeia archaeon]
MIEVEEIRVLVCDPIHEDGTRKLREAGLVVDERPTITEEDLMEVVGEYEAIVVRSRTKLTAEVLSAAERLKAVARAGVGLDNIDVKEAEARGIKVISSPEAPSVAVAELVMGFLLSLVRSIPLADRAMKGGEWIKKELMGRELREKTLGVIGFGRIGYQVAKRANAFEIEILVHDIAIEKLMRYVEEVGAEAVPLQELLRRSDFVTLHVPLLPQTRHMIGEKELLVMKDGAYLINTSRGGIVDEEALKKALSSGKLAGAALDVYETEPLRDTSLTGLDNVVCTPHIGAQTEEAQRANATIVAEKLIEVFRGMKS